jgi:hypothetical protein
VDGQITRLIGIGLRPPSGTTSYLSVQAKG